MASLAFPIQRESAPLRADEVCVGCIVWLPRHNSTRSVTLLRNGGGFLAKQAYNHPVVILKISPWPSSTHVGEIDIYFVIVTSKEKDYSIPIGGTTSLCDSLNLQLESCCEPLRKQSYVRLDNIHKTSLSNLLSYNKNPEVESPAYTRRLDEISYRMLTRRLNFEAQEYPSTVSIRSIRYARNPGGAALISSSTHTRDPRTSTVAASSPNQAENGDTYTDQVSEAASGSAPSHDLGNECIYAPLENDLGGFQTLQVTASPAMRPRRETIADIEMQRHLSHHPDLDATYDIEAQRFPPATIMTSDSGNDNSSGRKTLFDLYRCAVSAIAGYFGWMFGI